MNNSYVKPEVEVIEIKASQATIMTASDDAINTAVEYYFGVK